MGDFFVRENRRLCGEEPRGKLSLYTAGKTGFRQRPLQKYGQNDPAARFRAAGEIGLAHFARGFGVRGGRHLK